MFLKNWSKYLLIAGILLIWSTKLLIRPYVRIDATFSFLMGVAPNLLGSLLVLFGAYWLFSHPHILGGRLQRVSLFSDMRIVCLTGFLLGVINEYLQRITFFGRTFDYYDILFSAIGLLGGYYFFSVLQRRAGLMSYDPQQ